MVPQEQLRRNETHQGMHPSQLSLSLHQEQEADDSHWRLSCEGMTNLPTCPTSQVVYCVIDGLGCCRDTTETCLDLGLLVFAVHSHEHNDTDRGECTKSDYKVW